MIKIIFILGLVLLAGTAFATPSTTYWTPAVMDIQPYKVVHLGIDNYFITSRPSSHNSQDGTSQLPTDVGITVGVLPWEKLQAEVGVDALYATENPYSFNAKIGTPEDSLFKGSPGINLGVFNVGTKTGTFADGATNQDIVDFIVGKTLPGNLGRVHLAVYEGNSKVLKASDGSTHNKGYMVAYDYGFHSVKDKANNEYNQFVVAADYASGKNAIGGGGVGLYYYFTKDISLLTGPVWFNDKGINGPMKWTTQLDINF